MFCSERDNRIKALPASARSGCTFLPTEANQTGTFGPVCKASENIKYRNPHKEREPKTSRRPSVYSKHLHVVSAAISFALKPQKTLRQSDFYWYKYGKICVLKVSLPVFGATYRMKAALISVKAKW